jgi:hypothetical protein
MRRIGLALGHAVLAACVLSSCGGGNSSGASTSSSSTPGALMEDPPARLASLTAADFAAALRATSTGAQLLTLASGGTGVLHCGVDFHFFHYATVGGNATTPEKATASGALMVPTGTGCTGARGIVLHAHGTALTKDYNLANIADPTNEAYSEAAMIAAMYAAQGFIVVAPNYTGYKDSSLSYHPYLNGAQNGAEMMDALAAARTAIGSGKLFSPVTDNGKLFVTGYSEGGYVAMAAHKALQAAGITVTAAVHMSGPYATEALADAEILGNVSVDATIFMPLIVTSWQHAYGNLYAATTDLYESAFATGIDTLLPIAVPNALLDPRGLGPELLFTTGKLPPYALFNSTTPVAADFPAGTPAGVAAAIASQLTVPANPIFANGFGSPNLLKNSLRAGYALDALTPGNMDGVISGDPAVPLAAAPQHPLRVAAKANDMRSWAPTGAAPMLLCGGHDDPVVFYSVNTKTMLAFWAPLVAAHAVNEVDVDPGQDFALGGIAAQVAPAAAAAYGAALATGKTPAQLGAAVGAAVVGLFPTHFAITASGAVPIDPQGILVAGAAAVAEQVAVGDFTATPQVANPVVVGNDVATYVLGAYHGLLVQPACTAAAASFFAQF